MKSKSEIRLSFFSYVCILFSVLFRLNSVIAQEAEVKQTPEQSGSEPELPEPADGGVAGVIINSSNATLYKKIIIPEIYPLVRANLLELDAVKKLRVELALDENWNKPGAASLSDISEEGLLKEGIKPGKSFLFPALSESELSDDKDKKKQAYSLLWNSHAVFWGQGAFDADFMLSTLADNKITRQIAGHLVRVYPSVINPEDKSIQVFREKLTLTAPAAIKGFAWLTFRFFGLEEDMLWIFSPAINKVRQLTGSNRSDGILGSALGLDDLFAWSGKPELVEPVLDRKLTILVPFPDFEGAVLKTNNDSCVSISDESSSLRTTQWNFQSRRFPNAFGWIPSTAVFVPREVWRLELVPKDPYSQYGRQVLYVDAELMIPYYKFVYDRSGFLWKTIFSFFKQATAGDKSKTAFFNQYMIIDDKHSKEANIIEFSKSRYCSAYPAPLKLTDFDPQLLGAAKAPEKPVP